MQAESGHEPSERAPRKRVNLALQGGGAHGAFTWGVLDRLLEDDRIEIEGISGTSAGAMNAAVLTYGHAVGGAAEARRLLEHFWERIGSLSHTSWFQRSFVDRLLGKWRMDHSPGFVFMDLLSRLLSPYQLNPSNYNPIRGILEELVDFDILRHASGIKLFVCATNVRTGRPRVFSNRELDIDALLASAALPLLFQAVRVEDDDYWDGGYMGNPPLYPLIYGCRCTDVILVQVNPVCRDEVPDTAREILDRINEITFNSSLIHEMRAIQFVTRLVESGRLDPGEYKRMYVHLVEGEAEMGALGASSKLNPEPAFLEHLRGLGRASAARWLERHFDDVGRRSTLDIVKTYLAV